MLIFIIYLQLFLHCANASLLVILNLTIVLILITVIENSNNMIYTVYRKKELFCTSLN